MSRKKFTIVGILAIIIILLIRIGFWGYNFVKENNTYSNIIKSNWGIELSSEYKEIYSKDSGESFLGDGERYHIFEYKNDNHIKDCLDWQSDKNTSMESKIFNILSYLKVPKEYLPDFESDYKYYFQTDSDSSKIYIIFIEEINRIYIVEDIQ